LCIQFQRAIAALASDDVAGLETSTASQDGLVEILQDWFRGQPSGQPPSIKVSAADFQELVNLTRVYSSLLGRSLRTARPACVVVPDLQTEFPFGLEPVAATGWSCEV